MCKTGKIRPQQIRMAQWIIRELPEKDNSCTREEAAELLANDFKRAFKKGYSPKEICAIFKKAGIILAESLVARYVDTEDKETIDMDFLLAKTEKSQQTNASCPQKERTTSAEAVDDHSSVKNQSDKSRTDNLAQAKSSQPAREIEKNIPEVSQANIGKTEDTKNFGMSDNIRPSVHPEETASNFHDEWQNVPDIQDIYSPDGSNPANGTMEQAPHEKRPSVNDKMEVNSKCKEQTEKANLETSKGKEEAIEADTAFQAQENEHSAKSKMTSLAEEKHKLGSAKKKTNPFEDWDEPVSKPSNEDGSFEIIPDTPIGEL